MSSNSWRTRSRASTAAFAHRKGFDVHIKISLHRKKRPKEASPLNNTSDENKEVIRSDKKVLTPIPNDNTKTRGNCRNHSLQITSDNWEELEKQHPRRTLEPLTRRRKDEQSEKPAKTRSSHVANRADLERTLPKLWESSCKQLSKAVTYLPLLYTQTRYVH